MELEKKRIIYGGRRRKRQQKRRLVSKGWLQLSDWGDFICVQKFYVLLLHSFCDIKFVHIPRACNSVAHAARFVVGLVSWPIRIFLLVILMLFNERRMSQFTEMSVSIGSWLYNLGISNDDLILICISYCRLYSVRFQY